MSKYKIGEKVKYVGSGFIGFDKAVTEMIIVKKCPNYPDDWIVKYKDYQLSVMSHEVTNNN